MIETLSPSNELASVDSGNLVTREWIQSLPSHLKDEALYRLCKTIEAKPTLVESFTLNQVLYRTIKGKDEKFFESADNVAQRTGCDRKTILKGLALAVEQNILEKNERPGTSTEYFFKPVEEWKPEPVRNKDIRTQKVIEFPTTQNTEPEEINLPSGEDDVNRVVLNTDYPETDTSTIWIRNPDATRYCQIPPIHDQATGVEIQRQMDEEGLTAQKVVSRAVAFSKVPLMLLETLGAIGSKLLEGLSLVKSPEPSESVPVNVESAIASLADTMGRTTSRPSVTRLYGKGEDKIEYFRDFDLKECGVNLNDENLINVALAASSKDFEMATDCFLSWIARQKTDDEGNVLKIDRFGNVQKTTATQKFINAINYKWKPHGYESESASESLQNASAYSNTPVSVVPSYFELIKEALSSDDGDFIRAATMKIVPMCNENEEFFGFDFAKRCFEVTSKNPKSILINSVKSLVRRFGDKWGVVINDEGQVVAVPA